MVNPSLNLTFFLGETQLRSKTGTAPLAGLDAQPDLGVAWRVAIRHHGSRFYAVAFGDWVAVFSHPPHSRVGLLSTAALGDWSPLADQTWTILEKRTLLGTGRDLALRNIRKLAEAQIQAEVTADTK